MALQKSTGAEPINIMTPIQEVADQLRVLGVKIDPDGTLVMPAWTGGDDEPFEPASTPASPDLGVVSDTFWRLPEVIRSNHPFAFAASGPQAAWITSGPFPIPPHSLESPVGHVYELDGQVLLLGSVTTPIPRFTWRNSSQAFRTA